MLSLHVPSRHVALYDPGEFIVCKYPVLGRQHWPSPSLNRLGTPKYPTIRFRWVLVFRGFTGSHRYDLSSGSPPWRIRPGISRPTEAFTPGLPSGRSPSPTPGITTVVTGQSPPAGLSPAGTAASVAALSDTRCSTYLIFTAFFASGGSGVRIPSRPPFSALIAKHLRNSHLPRSPVFRGQWTNCAR